MSEMLSNQGHSLLDSIPRESDLIGWEGLVDLHSASRVMSVLIYRPHNSKRLERLLDFTARVTNKYTL